MISSAWSRAQQSLYARCSQRNETRDRAELMRAFQPGGPYAQVRGMYRHFGGARSVRVSGRFDPELVAALPDSLRFIVHNGAGYDQRTSLLTVDIPALSARGIQVANVPTVVNAATADTALFLLIGATRNFALAMGQLDAGKFNKQFPFRHAADPEGGVLGIIGAGGIGQELARKAANALGMRVVYHNRRRLDPAKEAHGMPADRPMEFVASLDELLEISDAVSVNCPLTPETRHILSTEQFKRMKRTAVLINTARGPVVDEAALVAALENDEISGAGLDVYENEVRIYLYSLLCIPDCLRCAAPRRCSSRTSARSASRPRRIWRPRACATWSTASRADNLPTQSASRKALACVLRHASQRSGGRAA